MIDSKTYFGDGELRLYKIQVMVQRASRTPATSSTTPVLRLVRLSVALLAPNTIVHRLLVRDEVVVRPGAPLISQRALELLLATALGVSDVVREGVVCEPGSLTVSLLRRARRHSLASLTHV